MNYKESKKIFEEIKKAKKILVNCHRGPDPDSIGSALAMYHVLKKMGRETKIICPSRKVYSNIGFLRGFDQIKADVDFSKFSFLEFDLFITLDSSNWDQVSGDKDIPIPNIPIVNIDHHRTNSNYGFINLVDGGITSVGELLFWVFQDWGVGIDKDIANCLMTAIIGDTGAFRYPGSTPKTFEAAKLLMEKGADKDKIIAHIYRSEPYSLVKFWGEALSRMKFDRKAKFVWSAIPCDIFEKLGKPENAKETAASHFTQIIEGSEFGIMMLEKEKGKLNVSFRSRTGIDVSKMALELGGGGHRYAAGGGVEGLPFDEAVEKVLKVARKHAKKYKGKSN